MLPSTRTPSFGPGLGLLSCRRSVVFHESIVEYGDEIIVAVQDAVNAVKARARSPPQPTQLYYYHTRFGRRALKCRSPSRWTTAQGNFRCRN